MTGPAVDGVAVPGAVDGVVVSGPAVDRVLTELREQARQLVADLAGPLRRIHLRRGDTVLEVEWHGRPVPDGSAPVTLDGQAGNGANVPGGVPADPGPPAEPVGPGPCTVVSPMVGTFYRAPEPGALPFIEVGDVVQPDRVIGIVEAMKLMNEIIAGQPGRVVDLLVADGQPVEFGQPLIVLAPV